MASVWSELKRRNVVKVAVAYAIVGWLLFQLTDVLISLLDLPEWVGRLVVLLVLIGFPLALIFAWAFELTPEGIKREKDVDRANSITQRTGQKLNYGIVGLLVLAVGFILVDKFVLDGEAQQAGGVPNTIAVLPFNSAVDEEGAQSIADGIQIEINTQLSRLGSLKVISGTSEYRDSPKNPRVIGEELNVAYLLEGRLQRAGDQVQINVILVDTQTGEQAWSDGFVRELLVENRFAVQKEMALAIAGQLQASLTPEEAQRLDEVPTRNSRAYDYYLAGLAAEVRYDLGADARNSQVSQQYERAIAEDPSFALAYARLSILQYYRGVQEGRLQNQGRRDNMLAYARRALDLQPELPEGHLALAIYYYDDFEIDRALTELAVAEQGLPNEPEIFKFKTWILRRIPGRLDEALEAGRHMVELDPRNEKEALFVLGPTYYLDRNYTEAKAALDKLLVIRPDHARARILRASNDIYSDGELGPIEALIAIEPQIYIQNGNHLEMPWLAAIYESDFDAALHYLETWPETGLETSGVLLWKSSYYGQTLQLAGLPDRAGPYFEKARAEIESLLESDPGEYRYRLAMAEIAAGFENVDEAIAFADRAMEMMPRELDIRRAANVQLEVIRNVLAVIGDSERVLRELEDYFSNPGPWSIEGLLPDPRFDFIRDDPRFLALVEKYRRK